MKMARSVHRVRRVHVALRGVRVLRDHEVLQVPMAKTARSVHRVQRAHVAL